jgi:glutamate transport system substrate-binding protein
MSSDADPGRARSPHDPDTGPTAGPELSDQDPSGAFHFPDDLPPAQPTWFERRREARRRATYAVRIFRLTAVTILLVASVVIATVALARIGPPSEDDLMRKAGLLDRDELLIGVKGDQPGVGLRDGKTGQFSGFDIAIAKMIAADLGFRPDKVRFLEIESEDRARRQALDNSTKKIVTVDLVVASFSITEQREKDPDVLFSAPYLRTEQSVITRRPHSKIEALGDLAGKTVCTLNTTTSAQALIAAGVKPVGKNKISECIDGLKSGAYEAVSTDAAILAGFEAADPKRYEMHDIGLETSEDWGVNVGKNPPLRTLVNLALYRSLTDPADSRWEDAYEEYFRREQPDAMPQQVAVDEQPTVTKPDVREWPWQQ